MVSDPPSIGAALEGATVIVNCSASDETIGKDVYRRELIQGQSARLIAGYIYANAGEGESTTDLVFGGHSIITENGSILKEAKRFCNQAIYSEIDVQRVIRERRQNTTFRMRGERTLVRVPFDLNIEKTELTRRCSKYPFVPPNELLRANRCEEILTIQAMGLKKRLAHTHASSAVVGISGGLDSTLALIVTARAFDLLGLDKKNIHAVTMPCFGTTDRTYQNACKMSIQLGATLREVPIAEAVNVHFRDIGHDPEDHSVTYENAQARCFGTTDRTYQNACKMSVQLGATLREVPIAEAVNVHFRDIGHDPEEHSVTYENAQARERTQVLMDIANGMGGMVIGTGDLSELALGWATYNGDHMSMYGVNASIPKTLVRYLVKHAADTTEDEALKEVLYDVLDTPVSPELLPPKDGDIAQKTEDLVGPYELHDFFLYYLLRFGYEPSKIYRLAKQTFAGEYDGDTILEWLKTFCRRFLPSSLNVPVCRMDRSRNRSAFSARGDWRMPSDACMTVWMGIWNR